MPIAEGITKEARRAQYSQKLKDPRWQKKRLEILQRDAFSCRQCGDGTKTLHVHHRRYIPSHDPWDYPDELLVALCEDCHAEETELWKSSIEDLEAILCHLGYFAGEVNFLTHCLLRSEAIPTLFLGVINYLSNPKNIQDLYAIAAKEEATWAPRREE